MSAVSVYFHWLNVLFIWTALLSISLNLFLLNVIAICWIEGRDISQLREPVVVALSLSARPYSLCLWLWTLLVPSQA